MLDTTTTKPTTSDLPFLPPAENGPRALVTLLGAETAAGDEKEPKDRTAAERQRRRRDRKRDANRDTVTASVTRTVTPAAAWVDPSPRTIEEAINSGAVVLCARQHETCAYINDNDALVIRQDNWPDDDSVIIVAKENIGTFIDVLTDLVGIPSVP